MRLYWINILYTTKDKKPWMCPVCSPYITKRKALKALNEREKLEKDLMLASWIQVTNDENKCKTGYITCMRCYVNAVGLPDKSVFR